MEIQGKSNYYQPSALTLYSEPSFPISDLPGDILECVLSYFSEIEKRTLLQDREVVCKISSKTFKLNLAKLSLLEILKSEPKLILKCQWVHDLDFLVEAVKVNPSVFKYVSKKMTVEETMVCLKADIRTNRFIDESICNNSYLQEYIKSSSLKIWASYKGRANLVICSVSDAQTCKSKENALFLMSTNSLEYYRYLPIHFQIDTDVVEAALTANPKCFMFFPDKVKTVEFIMNVLDLNDDLFKYLPNKFKENITLIKKAITIDARNLKHAITANPFELKELIEFGVKNSKSHTPYLFKYYANEPFLRDSNVIINAIKRNTLLNTDILKYLEEDVLNRPEIVDFAFSITGCGEGKISREYINKIFKK